MPDQSTNQYMTSLPMDSSSLSGIIQAAMLRRQQQQQQQMQMLQSVMSAAGRVGQQQQPIFPGNTLPGDFPLNQAQPVPGYRIGGVVPPVTLRYRLGGVAPLRYAWGGVAPRLGLPRLAPRPSQFLNPQIGAPREAQYMQQGGVAPDLQGREREGGPISPQEMDLLWQARQRAAEEARARAMNEQPVEHFAGGGVSWSDPYGNSPLAAEEYNRQFYHLADPSHMVGNILHNRIAQQQLQQEQMNTALGAATKMMQQQRTDAIGQALLQNDPETANDPLAGRIVAAGGSPMQAYQIRKQQIADEADAQRQATGDYWSNLARQEAVNKPMGLDAYGQQLPQSATGAGQPQTTIDDQGREWRLGAGGHWYPMRTTVGPNEEPPADFPESVTSGRLPEIPSLPTQVITPDEAPGQSQPPSFSGAPQPQGTGAVPSGMVRVRAPNGQAGSIPADKLQAALSAGYTQL